MSCGPADEARMRVVNAVSEWSALDVEVAGIPLAHSLRFGEVSRFLPLAPGDVPATVQSGGTAVLATTLTLSPGAEQTLLLTPAPVLLTHAFSSPIAASMRVRLFNGLPEAAEVELADSRFRLSAGADSGPDGLVLTANRQTSLTLIVGVERLSFTVPALPAESELLLVVSRAEAPVLLAIAPSAALGLLSAEGK